MPAMRETVLNIIRAVMAAEERGMASKGAQNK
jgi:hypothetical protein